MSDAIDIFKVIGASVGLLTGSAVVIGWFTQGVKIAEKAKNAPTKEEMHEEARKVEDKVMSELQPMKEDLREIKTDLKWLVKEKK